MSVSLYEGQIRQKNRQLESARKKRSTAESKASKLGSDIYRLERQAGSTKSDSMLRGYLSQAEKKKKELVSVHKTASDALSEINRLESGLRDSTVKLRKAEESDKRRQSDRDRRQKKQDERKQQQADREQKRRDDARDQKLGTLSARADELEEELREAQRRLAPPEITVLFLAASPGDQDALRLDKEASEIEKKLRLTEHRDSIRFVSRLARQVTDLLQDLNETQPHIVHFSGHGDQESLVFENADETTRVLTNEQLAQLLKIHSDQVRLAVFNSCQSASQAELACDYVDLAIGMSASVEDAAAQTFAAQFYNSLGFGHSVERAFEEAKFAMALEPGDEQYVPQLFTCDGVDAKTVVLVNPDQEASSL